MHHRVFALCISPRQFILNKLQNAVLHEHHSNLIGRYAFLLKVWKILIDTVEGEIDGCLSLVIHADADERLQLQSFLSDFRVGAGVVAHGSKLVDQSIRHGELAEFGSVGLWVVVERSHVG